MSNPLSKLHVLGTSAESQEVSLDVERSVLLLEEVLGNIVIVAPGGAVVVNSEARGDRGRTGHGCRLESVSSRGRSLARSAVVVVVVVVVHLG